MKQRQIARGLLREHPGALVLLKHLGDLVLVFASGWLTHVLVIGSAHTLLQLHETILLAMLVLTLCLSEMGLYRTTRNTPLSREIEILAAGWVLSLGLLGAYLWLRGRLDEQELKWLVLWLGAGWSASIGMRLLARWLMGRLRRKGFNQRTVVIAVASELGVQVAQRLRSRPEMGIAVAGFFDDRAAARRTASGAIPVLGSVAAMGDFVSAERIDQVWIALPFRAESRIREILHALRHSMADVCLVPDVFQFSVLNQSLDEVAGIPLVALNASPMQGTSRLLKALEDKLLASAILLLVSPLLLLVALAVRLDSPGPILFKQRRRGLHDETIEVWKFRSMRQHYQAPGTYTLAMRNDARVTAVGAFLRRTSLDELPQFFNVLQGHMSIVGPRPYPIEINNEYKDLVDRYMLRHKVKPGITGWAQVNGLRGALDTPGKMERRVQHDLYYIENWSLWFDLKIIAMTIVHGFVNENAY